MKITTWRKYPICLLGYDIRRWESTEGDTWYINDYIKKLLIGIQRPYSGPTHIQYWSPWGFLITWPLCFHFWWQFRQQELGRPGTEKVLLLSIGWARWDAGDACYMIPRCYVGLRWD